MKSKGFTIIETVIALFVLSAGVISVYAAFSVMAVATSDISSRFIAAYLAQEGIETVRNIRDSNWISGNEDWTAGLAGCEEGCEADYTSSGDVPLSPWPEGSLPEDPGGNYLKLDSNNFYDYSSGENSKFKRKITIESIPDDEGQIYILKVTAEVFWDQKTSIINLGGSPGVFKAEEYLYDWY